METGIYEILNTANGKWYRGQTTDGFKTRWYHHKYKLNSGKHFNEHLQNAWNKYGSKVFKFTVLSRCAPEFCNDLEKYWIGEDYKRRWVSYNMKAGGENDADFSDDARQKMSKAHMGKTLSEEHKRKISAGLKGRKRSIETAAKIRKTQGHHFEVRWPDGRVKQYLSVHEAGPDLGVSSGSVFAYLKGRSTPGKRKESAHLKGCTFTYRKEQQ